MTVSAVKNGYLKFPWISGSRTADEPAVNEQENKDAIPLFDENDLVRKAQAHDAAAFERLYELHVRRMYALSLRMVSNHRRAEELTQDIFVRAWEAISSFKFQSAFGTWLHRLGTNVVLGHLRAEKRREGRVSTTDDLEAFDAGVRQAMPETKLDLERAIASLPDGAREVLVLHDIEGYRYREIAEMTEIAEGTVKSQLNRARRLVREALLK
jgi:RNA polymerase sigma-70 factor (ECF subfamily)